MNKYKFVISAIFLFIINILIKGFLLEKVPNSISLKEITLLSQINLFTPINNYSYRYFPLIISAFISIFTFILLFKKTKNYWLSISTGLVLTFTPWLYILSRFFNYYTTLLLFVITIFLFFSKRLLPIVVVCVLLSCFTYLILLKTPFLLLRENLMNIPNLFMVYDFRTLFFNGDPSSRMYHTPLTGFFFYLDFFAFYFGLYYVFISKNANKFITYFVTILFFIGSVFFVLLSNDELYSIRGVIIFYSISIVIACGYYFIFSLINKKFFIIKIFTFIIIAINIIFFIELFYNHFSKHNSFEWGYAEQKVVQYIINNPNKKILLSEESNVIDKYLTYFSKKPSNKNIVSLNNAIKVCKKNTNFFCIIREHELIKFFFQKDDVKIKFSNYDGLPVYFLVPNQ